MKLARSMVVLEGKGQSAFERLIVLYPYSTTLTAYQNHDIRSPAVKLRDMIHMNGKDSSRDSDWE
jgi:hypothetical protein